LVEGWVGTRGWNRGEGEIGGAGISRELFSCFGLSLGAPVGFSGAVTNTSSDGPCLKIGGTLALLVIYLGARTTPYGVYGPLLA
jgi:hypothetical protein